MKALLIVIVLYVGESTTSFVQPMPTMEGCNQAAQKIMNHIRDTQGSNDFWKRYINAICVENR